MEWTVVVVACAECRVEHRGMVHATAEGGCRPQAAPRNTRARLLSAPWPGRRKEERSLLCGSWASVSTERGSCRETAALCRACGDRGRVLVRVVRRIWWRKPAGTGSRIDGYGAAAIAKRITLWPCAWREAVLCRPSFSSSWHRGSPRRPPGRPCPRFSISTVRVLSISPWMCNRRQLTPPDSVLDPRGQISVRLSNSVVLRQLSGLGYRNVAWPSR
jgi:hypothetical protein